MNQFEQLEKEIEIGRKEIKTDSLSMTIGEVINLYKDNDIELSPIYQRLFRWNNEQKSRFIESIILGIPLPSIFVAQQSDGKWSVVDGLQRLSTILQFVGELNFPDNVENEENENIDSSDYEENGSNSFTLVGTKKLEALNGLSWNTLPIDIQRIIKRSKLSINIILLTEDNIQSQYEVFQRLNTGGLHLEAQEIRNCLIIMLDKKLYDCLEELKNYDSFLKAINLTENKLKKEYHMELILRYFIAKHNHIDTNYNLSTISIDVFLDNETTRLINDISIGNFNLDEEKILFKKTFDFIYTLLNENPFKKFNNDKCSFEGPFFLSAYEAITTGVALNINKIELCIPENWLGDKIREMYSNNEFLQYSTRGTRAPIRFIKMIEFSTEYFSV